MVLLLSTFALPTQVRAHGFRVAFGGKPGNVWKIESESGTHQYLLLKTGLVSTVEYSGNFAVLSILFHLLLPNMKSARYPGFHPSITVGLGGCLHFALLPSEKKDISCMYGGAMLGGRERGGGQRD